jgi:hypothetical protein
MRLGKVLFLLALFAGLTLFTAADSRAGLITLDSTSSAGGNTIFTYGIAVPTGDSIAQGDFFRIYDFNGYVPGSITAPANWTASVALSNPTPPPDVILNHGDDPAITNLIFTYTGSTPLLEGTTVTGFSATTTGVGLSSDPKNAVAEFTSTSSPNVGSADAYRTDVSVPGANAVPEPASMVSGGLGAILLAIGYGFRSRRKLNA